jgi:Protein of unknown function (DUF3667)
MELAAAATRCRNCHTFLGDPPGNFCPGCGQDTANHPPTFWEFVHEFITHYVALEGKLWRTLRLLFFKPAELTREFRAGRKQRYISPLRLYITASFLFFMVVKIAGWGSLVHVEMTTSETPAAAKGISYSFSTERPPSKSLDDLAINQAQINLECWPPLQNLCGQFQTRLEKKYTGKTTGQVIDMLRVGMLANFPYALFLLLPLFALLTKLIYVRRGIYFGEHVVYALHVHAFTFFVLLFKAILPRYMGDGVVLAALVYYFIAMQRFYGGRWWATALRYAVVATVYPLLLVMATATVVLYVLIA